MDNSSPKPGTSTRKPTPAEARRALKNERKRAGQEAARAAAAARKRRNAGLGAGLGVLAIVAIVVLITTLGGSPAKKTTASSSPSASASTSAAPVPVAGPQAATSGAPSAAPTPAYTPDVPAGESSKLKTKPVVKAGTGTVTKLKVTTLVQGKGAAIKSGDSITADYVGVTYKDGVEFDSSWKDGQDFTTTIGTGSVIPGWDQGLIGVKAGSRVQLDIPVALAYGTPTPAGDPAGDLRFVIDVLAVNPAS